MIAKQNLCAAVGAEWRRAMIVGYARVSTDGQTLDAQQSALAAAGAERVFAEKVSGAVTDRKALGRAIAALCAGDVLLVTRLDRLARSTRDLLNVLDAVAKAWCGVSVAGGCVGGYDDTARAADAHCARWPCGVRAGANPRTHGRGTYAGTSSRGEVRAKAGAERAPAGGGACASGGGGGLHRNRSELRGQPQHDQSACGGVAPSELADGVSPTSANSNPIQQHRARTSLDEASASLPHPTRQCGLAMLR